jgi:hypothetical protein
VAGEEVGASAADPELLPAEGAGVRDIPKEPRLQAGEIKRWEMSFKKGKGGASGLAQVVEHLISKGETLSSNPSTAKKKKEGELVIPAVWKLKQENLSFRPAWATQQDPSSKKKKERKRNREWAGVWECEIWKGKQEEREERSSGTQSRLQEGQREGMKGQSSDPNSPLPGYQSRGLSLQSLQSLLDLQQGLHGTGIGEDRE